MIEIDKVCFQGDVCFRRVKSVPKEAKRIDRKGPIVVAHSETGHHHMIDAAGVLQFDIGDPLKCYLMLESTDHCEVVHHRPFDTHESIGLGGGIGSCFEVIRQQEYSPQGWRRVED